jgi:recombinase
MSKETEKVRRWRDRMKAEGKQAITLWLNRDAVERLNTLAAEAKITVSEFIERAVTVTQPKVTDTTAKVTEKVTDTVTDTTTKVTDTVAVIRELVREEVERALHQVPKPRVTVTKPKVTDTVTDTTAKVTDTARKDRALTAEKLANAAMTLHQQGFSYEQIARQWDTEGIPTLRGGRWHKGTIGKLVQRHQRR